MRFSLQDVKKSIHRRGAEFVVALHFLQPGELHAEIGRLIDYHERLLGEPQREFSLDEARSYVGDYRLAYCLLATLSNWYEWRSRAWAEVVQEFQAALDVSLVSSAAQLRLLLYDYVNEQYAGFLAEETREAALQAFAERIELNKKQLEYLLSLDSDEEALLTRNAAQPPEPQEVATLYNQWVFEAALFNASNVHFVVDCAAFGQPVSTEGRQGLTPALGVGNTIKRLCFLARKLGVYYDLAYEEGSVQTQLLAPLLSLTLYGPQEVTGAPQQYGLRLARLCRTLLGYGAPLGQSRKRAASALSTAVVAAEATVHFLQRAYTFPMDAALLQLLPSVSVSGAAEERSKVDAAALFDSSIEQAFAEAFTALAGSRGVDGWLLEREPEPLLLADSIFIPDFAFTRGQRRIYMEILGFWTPAYRERKIQKLQQLQDRDDLVLAIPKEAVAAFKSIAAHFPIVEYDGQLSVTEVLRVLRSRYDNFAERLQLIEPEQVRERVKRSGLLSEEICYELLHCYRRSELPVAAERVVGDAVAFVQGLGLYTQEWMAQLQYALLAWLQPQRSASLTVVLQELRTRWPELAGCDDAALETLLSLWPAISIRRDSIFEARVELNTETEGADAEQGEAEVEHAIAHVKETRKKATRERRATPKKVASQESETVQGNLWG
ncbi:DUF790 family protein [Ktedonosporobacter rubrisoli]|uniref:DUF790 family protein n=1 Tax=Ktedonosporobacter rubrisoli TaxID=2509675 RepID=UPI0013EEA5BC|nr:DUF790 family protein [Ktedonosporobacter rubrisoli]